MEIFLLTLSQIGIMFTFIIIGYALCKGKIITDAKVLSTLLMWIFLPAIVFNTFCDGLTVENLKSAFFYLLAGAVVLGLSLAIFYPILKRYKDKITRNTYLYSMAVTNMMYMGVPLIEKVFGQQASAFFIMFTISVQFFVFTVGAMMFAPEGKKISAKSLLSPIMIALGLGMLCGPIFSVAKTAMPDFFANIKGITTFFKSILGMAAGCMSPIAMLITGITLAKLPLLNLFKKGEAYLFSLIRLIAIPAVFGGLAYLCHLWFHLDIEIVKLTIIYCSLPMGLNTVVFVESNGGDGTLGAQCACISHLLSIATLPLVFGLVGIL